MSMITKMNDGEGTFTVLVAGKVVRGSMSAQDADEVVIALEGMEADDRDAA